MDLARSRRYLKAVGVVLWRPRDSLEAELETLRVDAEQTATGTDAEMALAAASAPPPKAGAPNPMPAGATALGTTALGTTTATGAPVASGRGLAGIAAARAALGTVAGAPDASRATSPPAPPASLPPDSPIAAASPPARSGAAPSGRASHPTPLGPEPAAINRQDSADAQAIAAMDWSTLETEVRQCRRCGLCERRTQSVFGVGNRETRLMLVGEAPGADEDRQGEPFVGPAGQLLTRMLAAIDLPREQVYIGNIIKCRPPGNRDPLPEEIAVCRAFVERQIALIGPRLLLCLGRISAQALLQTGDALWRLRGRWHSFGQTGIPLLVTYHPSYYLRTPAEKARGWEDLQQVARRLRAL